MILKSIFALKTKSRVALLIALSLAFPLIYITPAFAVDRRVIDVVSVNWSGATALKGSVSKIEEQIDNVVTPWWRDLTSIQGDPVDRRIEFYSGEVLASPIQLTFPIPCQNNFTAWTNSIRNEAYKRLNIADPTGRYLVVTTPDAGCIWSGRALIGDVKKSGGVIVLHNSAEGFVIAHELGHALGLGHTNLIRCPNGSPDGPWTACKAIEYGGAIDLMSNVEVKTPLSTYHQWRMNLLESKDVVQSWKSESIEINPVDLYGKPRAIFLRDGLTTYWVEYRRETASNGAGLVIYRTDPPPSSSIQSPNEIELVSDPREAIGTDIWMLNLDNYDYTSGKASGSMTLRAGTTASISAGAISVTATTTDVNTVIVKIERSDSGALRAKPKLTSKINWNSLDSRVIEEGYTNSIGGASEYEARIDNKVGILRTTDVDSWEPTYLNPFSAPRVLKVRDLPEGQYELAIRVRDFSGVWSPWSDSINVNIDRGLPLVGNSYKLLEYSSTGVRIEFSKVLDEGSGLCFTELVNPEGWILSRSTARNKPILDLGIGVSETTFQTFDCLGNGQQGSLSARVQFDSAGDMRRVGKWTPVTGRPAGTMKCTGKCSAYVNTKGTVAPIILSGSAEVSAKGVTSTGTKSVEKGERLEVNSREVGNRRTGVKVTGRDFVLMGVLSADLSITKLSPAERAPLIVDNSLNEGDQRALAKFGFNREDFSPEWEVFPMGRGTTLEDPTLDLCSNSFTSEVDRRERRQVVVSKKNSPYLFLSSETVRYRNVVSAERALTELKSVYEKCLREQGGADESGSFTKYEFLSFPEIQVKLVPEGKRLIVHARIGEGESARILFGIYQYKAEMFTGLYVVKSGSSGMNEDEMKRWLMVAARFAERLG